MSDVTDNGRPLPFGRAADFECFAPGVPRPQGSKTRNANGSMRESSRHVKAWRETVVYAALAARTHVAAMDGPLMLGVAFLFRRPGTRKAPGAHWRKCDTCKGHGSVIVKAGATFASGIDARAHCKPCYGLGLLLRPTAPIYMMGVPDKDKLVRAVGDALKIAGVVKDDSLFVRDHESGCKRYANPGEQPGAWIRIWKL